MTQSLTQPAALASADRQAAQAWLNQGSQALPLAPALEEVIEEKRFLRFALSTAIEDETALLPLDSIQEVSQIPQRSVLPVPEVPDAVLGVANCRGSILWLVDLRQLLGQSAAAPAEDGPRAPGLQFFHTLTIQAAGQNIGLVVPRVMDIEIFEAKALHPPTADLFPGYLLPFLAGYLQRSPVLSASALIETLQMQR